MDQELQLKEWSQEKLQWLIDNRVEEHAKLEYKAALALGRQRDQVTEITKDVSAFANSDGGTIVYGIKESADKRLRHFPETIDPVNNSEFSKEWLEHVIGQICPRIESVTIHPVQIGNHPNQFCFVVEIPKGETAHQARDHRYYRRYNFESVSMADYEIRDVMNRRKHPELEFKIRVHEWTSNITTRIEARIWNTGTVLAKHYALRILVPGLVGKSNIYRENLVCQQVGGLKYWRLGMGGTFNPLFPGYDAIRSEEIPHCRIPMIQPTGDALLCTLFADEMPFIERQIPVALALKDWA